MANPAGLPDLGVWRNHGYQCTNQDCPDAKIGYPPENPEVTHLHPNTLYTRVTAYNPPTLSFDVLQRVQIPHYTTSQGITLEDEVFSKSFRVQVKAPGNIETRIATSATKTVNEWSYTRTREALYPNKPEETAQTGANLEDDY